MNKKLQTINTRLRQLWRGGAGSTPLFLELHAEQHKEMYTLFGEKGFGEYCDGAWKKNKIPIGDKQKRGRKNHNLFDKKE